MAINVLDCDQSFQFMLGLNSSYTKTVEIADNCVIKTYLSSLQNGDVFTLDNKKFYKVKVKIFDFSSNANPILNIYVMNERL